MSCNGRPPISPPEVCPAAPRDSQPLAQPPPLARLLNLAAEAGASWVVPPPRPRPNAGHARLLYCTDTPDPAAARAAGYQALAVPSGTLDPAGELAAAGIGVLAHDFTTTAFRAYATGMLGGAAAVMLPGQVVQVLGCGLLITGPAGCGKSEATLGLLDRGHRLVADDAFVGEYRPAPGWHARSCAEGRGRLAVRGLGIIDVPRAFGAASLADATPLHLEVHLSPGLTLSADGLLHGQWRIPTLPGLPCLALPCEAGRNLPLLLETAARQHTGR